MLISCLRTVGTGLVAMGLLITPAQATKQPEAAAEIARPGGAIPKGEGLALVKVADGFIDPVNVANAGDKSGRVFVVERVGKIQIVYQDGTRSDKPFVDLTQLGASVINPTGGIVQSQFIEMFDIDQIEVSYERKRPTPGLAMRARSATGVPAQ